MVLQQLKKSMQHQVSLEVDPSDNNNTPPLSFRKKFTNNNSLLVDDENAFKDSFDYGEWSHMRESRDRSSEHSAYSGNWLSVSFMGWLFKIVKYGWSHSLQSSDVPGLPSYILSTSFIPKFDAAQRCRKKPETKFAKMLWNVPLVKRTLIFGSILTSLQGVVGTVARPMLLKVVIQFVEGTDYTFGKAIVLLILFGAVVFFEGWLGVHGRQLLGEDFAAQFQIAAGSVVYRKMLRINTQKVREDASTETSLLGNDAIRAYENIRSAQNLPMAICGVLGGVVVLIVIIGPSSLVGLAIMFSILLSNLYIGKKTHQIEQRNLVCADARLTVLGRILEGIKAVKFFGWENKFMKILDDIREAELKQIRNYRILHVSSIASGRGSPVLSSMVALLFYTLSGNTLTLANAYATVSVFQALRVSLIFLPLGLTAAMALDVTFKRIDEYLGREEKDEKRLLDGSDDAVLHITQCDIGWVLSESCVYTVTKDISLSVQAGQVVGIVGSVGSGKSSLIATAVQAIMPLNSNGVVETAGSIGFSPQKPFVVCGTIKQNILLGRAYDETMFSEVLTRSGFAQDLLNLSNGVLTEIGERGTTLSGGQQTRMAIARALYGYPDLLVFDDPLSAVDPQVARHMFDYCIMEPVRTGICRGCLISLNQIELLPKLDKIVFIFEETYVQGSYDELILSCEQFRVFVQAHINEEDEGEELDGPEEGHAPTKGITNRASTDADPSAVTHIMAVEKRKSGAVSWHVYVTYIRDMGYFFFAGCCILCLLGYIIMSANDYWLAVWQSNPGRDGFYAGIYAALSVSFAILILIASYMMCLGGVKASQSIHRSMIRKLLSAPMYWFETTASGRIISRFSGDLAKVDMILSLSVDNMIQILFNLAVLLAVLIIAVPFMAIVIAFIAVLYAGLIMATDRTARDIKRISNNALSPLLSNAAEAVRGRDLVVSMGCMRFFEIRHQLATDEFTKSSFVSGSLINFGFLCAHMLSFVVSVSSATLLLLLPDNLVSSDLLGLSLTYAFLVPYFSSTLTQVAIRMNSFFTALERLLEYDNLAQEPLNEGLKPAVEEWPKTGTLSFQNVCLRYRKELPLVLKGVTFEIPNGSLVGICGRTGSGKSSCIAALFRLVEIESGTISIDGMDTRTVSLSTLRNRLTIIPQDPILMEGTIQSNLDPFGEYEITDLERALATTGLKNKVSLDDPVESGGNNWSAGERQILCFARALLRRHSKIIVMDEPTSSIDMNTDQLIQDMVKEQFHDKTVLCIAHRLNTIVDYDLVMVMNDGVMMELDSPKRLLEKKDSKFYEMVASMGAKQHRRMLHRASTSRSALRIGNTE